MVDYLCAYFLGVKTLEPPLLQVVQEVLHPPLLHPRRHTTKECQWMNESLKPQLV